MHKTKIVLIGDCQIQQLALCLSAASNGGFDIIVCPGSANTLAQRILEKWGNQRPDLIVSNANHNRSKIEFEGVDHLPVPSIHFAGFHPDVVYMRDDNNQSKPIFFLKNASASGLTINAYNRGISWQQAAGLHNKEYYEELGFIALFDTACKSLQADWAFYGLDVNQIEKHIVSGQVFMYGPLHPKLSVVISLAFAVVKLLGIQPQVSESCLSQILRCPKEYEYAWSCFPPVADELGIDGGWGIRHQNRLFLSINQYVRSFYHYLDQLGETRVALSPPDRVRFTEAHQVDRFFQRLR